MKLGLSIPPARPRAKPIGMSLLEDIRRMGFEYIRVDVPDQHEDAWEVINELVVFPWLTPIFVIAGGEMRRNHPGPDGAAWDAESLEQHVRDTCVKLQGAGFFDGRSFAIEIGNEPDIAAKEWQGSGNAKRLWRVFVDSYEVIRGFSQKVDVLTPSISNLDKDSIAYFRAMVEHGLPALSAIAVHRYPKVFDPSQPHDGFRSRSEELSAIRKAAPNRDVWVTEFGITEVRKKNGLFGKRTKRISEAEAEKFIFDDVRYWASEGVKVAVLYQLNDGPSEDDYLHQFGIRNVDGSWEGIAARLPELAREVSA